MTFHWIRSRSKDWKKVNLYKSLWGVEKTKVPKQDSQGCLCLRREGGTLALLITLFRNCKFK